MIRSVMTLFGVLFLLISGSTYSASLQVVTEDWPPYNFLNKQGKIAGKSTNLVKKILAESGLDYELKLYPWARSYQMALTQKNVLIYTIIQTEQRKSLFHWFCPIHPPVKIYYYKLRGNKRVHITHLEDAKNYRVGVARGDWNEAFLLKQGFTVGQNLDIAATDDANLQTLLAGRIDLMLNSEPAMMGRLKKVNLPYAAVEKAFPNNVTREDASCMALSKSSDKAVVEAISQAFEQVVLKGDKGL